MNDVLEIKLISLQLIRLILQLSKFVWTLRSQV